MYKCNVVNCDFAHQASSLFLRKWGTSRGEARTVIIHVSSARVVVWFPDLTLAHAAQGVGLVTFEHFLDRVHHHLLRDFQTVLCNPSL